MGYHSLRTTLIDVFASGGAIVRHKLRVGHIGFERLRTRRESGLGSTLIDLTGECCARQRKGGDHQSGGNERLLEHSISSVLEALSCASNCSFGAGGTSVTHVFVTIILVRSLCASIFIARRSWREACLFRDFDEQ